MSGAIHTETKPYSIYIEIKYYNIFDYMMRLMKLNLQIIKNMIKLNKQWYFDVSLRE